MYRQYIRYCYLCGPCRNRSPNYPDTSLKCYIDLIPYLIGATCYKSCCLHINNRSFL